MTYAVFYHVAREGSFSQAAEQLGMPKSTVSLKVRELEESLGVRLLQRTTRQLSLTEHGQLFFKECNQMLMSAESATRMMQGLLDEPRGILRFSCPYGLSGTHFPSIISTYAERYPQVKLQIISTNERHTQRKSLARSPLFTRKSVET